MSGIAPAVSGVNLRVEVLGCSARASLKHLSGPLTAAARRSGRGQGRGGVVSDAVITGPVSGRKAALSKH